MSTEAEAIAKFAVMGMDTQRIDVEGIPFLLVPPGVGVHNMESSLAVPRRVDEHRAFETVESFGQYVNQFKAGNTQLFAYRKANAVQAILDYHEGVKASHCSHKASLMLKHSTDWLAWAGRAKAGLTAQVPFAEFLDEHIHCIAAPDGAVLRDMVLRFSSTKETTFRSAVSLQNGDVQVVFIEDSERGTEGTTRLPSELDLRLVCFEGQLPVPVRAKLRYRVKEGALFFSVVLVGVEQIIEAAFRDALEAVENLVGLVPMMSLATAENF